VAGNEVSDDELAAQWSSITAAVARIQRLLEADVEQADVAPAWFPVLDRLLRAEGHRLPMSTLARELAMTSGGFSKLADRMALDGLIDRRGTTDDRRVVHATLTEAGVQVARRAHAVHAQALRARLLTRRSAADLASVADTLAALAATQDGDPPQVTEQLAAERDPALPDRRGRDRPSDSARL
jgi:DNA-binding MarR family transcriptional regulator